MQNDKSRKADLKILIRKKKKQEQRDWRLTMKRLRKFQSDVLNHRTSDKK
ncbi:hypothetical protein ACFFH4_17255 [Halalkalibacter alkalisediminis]|uniref:Uncharacterized protein n=1 Tax=Halalkalibacter alkalisediminis TaxID=935616 RepID=A0ABV6NIY9_9BACI